MNESLRQLLSEARRASRCLNRKSTEEIDHLLMSLADEVEKSADSILEANSRDLARMDDSNPKYDRLRLSRERIADIASGIRNVAALPSPLNRTLAEWTQPNGMHIRKTTVPFGVIGIIYEARPNVTLDVASLCLKSGNACLLKGGSDAEFSNRALTKVIARVLVDAGFPEACVSLLPSDHATTKELLQSVGFVDLVIPRGSRRLIEFVRENARVPVIETGAGVCHCYFHSSGNLAMGKAIVENAKTRRVSVCNALDCLLIDRDRLQDLPALVEPLAVHNVTLYADAEAHSALSGKYPLLEHARDDDFGKEFLDYKMSIRVVNGMEEALNHIALYSSKHSESIIADDNGACTIFEQEVDAACVYANLPTSFTDGGQFGFGAEIGISTQKLHARGPMALPEMTTYKYIVTGNGQIRKP